MELRPGTVREEDKPPSPGAVNHKAPRGLRSNVGDVQARWGRCGQGAPTDGEAD